MYISEEDYIKIKQMAENYDKVKAAQKKYRDNHKEIVSQRIKDWREKNPEKFNAIQKRYKEKKKQIDNNKNDVKMTKKGELK